MKHEILPHCPCYCCSWLREQHAIPGAVNALFAPRLTSRIKISVANQLFAIEDDNDFVTPNHSLRVNPLLTSTPHSEVEAAEKAFEYEPVDVAIKNPLFSSGLQLQKVSLFDNLLA